MNCLLRPAARIDLLRLARRVTTPLSRFAAIPRRHVNHPEEGANSPRYERSISDALGCVKRFGFLVAFLCTLLAPAASQAAIQISVSADDLYTSSVWQYDSSDNTVDSLTPLGGVVSDISVDPVTGNLYALTQGGVKRYTPSSGWEHLGLQGAHANGGGDLEVYDGKVFMSFRDYTYYQVLEWDTNNANAHSVWNTGYIDVSDISVDPVTGDLYALTNGGVIKRTPTNGFTNLGLTSVGTNMGGDLEVYDGLVSVSRTDNGGFLVYQWDTSNSNAYNQWHTGDSYVSDIAVDSVTGDLYALTSNGIRRQTAENNWETLGLISAPRGDGGDLQVISLSAGSSGGALPEPTTFVVWGVLLCGVGTVVGQRRLNAS